MKIKKILLCALSALLVLSACCGCGQQEIATDAAPVKIATKPMTESYILGEMLSALIEDSGYTTEITKGIKGGTTNIQPAMESGEFDLYPEYTSSGWVNVLGNEAGSVDDDDMLEALQKAYSEKFGMTWIALYGFNNTYCITVSKEVADKYSLKKTSDLAAVAGELTIGVNPDYAARADGLDMVCNAYNLKFKEVKEIEIGIKYTCLDNNEIQVTNGFTTDAQLATGNYIALEDDKNIQATYNCSTVVRQDCLDSHPGLEKVLKKMDGLISNEEMAALNYAVEVEKKDEKEVARAFLVSKGLLDE